MWLRDSCPLFGSGFSASAAGQLVDYESALPLFKSPLFCSDQNIFSPLSDAHTKKPDERALVIGDSIVLNVKIETPATRVQCLPGARAPDILANLKVLANAKRKFSKIIHVDANDVQLCQSDGTSCKCSNSLNLVYVCVG